MKRKLMLPGWNSLETASFMQNLLTVLSYVCLAGLLVFEVGAHVYGNRKEVMLEELSKQKDAEVQALKTELDKEKSTFRALSAAISVSFNGIWDEADLPFSNSNFMMPPNDTQFFQMVASLDGELRYVNMYGTRMYRFEQQSKGHYIFRVDVALKSDDLLLGHSFDVLKDVNGAAIFVPIIYPNKLKDPNLNVTAVTIDITVNNQKHIKKEFLINAVLQPAQIPNESRFPPVSIPLRGIDFL